MKFERKEYERQYAKDHPEWNSNKSANYTKKYPERRKLSIRNTYLKARAEIWQAYGNKCACCGDSHREFFTIDHIDGKGAEHRRSIGGDKRNNLKFYGWLRENGYPKDNFQLLCFNCNFAKGKYGQCPHKLELNLLVGGFC